MKKQILTIAFLLGSLVTFSQKSNYNLEHGYIARGYDVVSYFEKLPQKGNDMYTYNYDGIKFKFTNQDHLNLFKANPKKYIPQYGGWCAYAMGENGKKVSIDPKTYEIRDGKLYLFYNSWGTNTLKLWLKKGADKLKVKADENWGKYSK